MKLKTYQQFLNEAKQPSDLHKIYLVYNPDLGHRFWTYKDFAADKYFVRLTPDNYKKIDVDKNLPVLTYHSDTCQMLIDEGLIKEENVYNHPKFIKNSGSKAKFHKLVDGDENIPKTCHKKEDAINEIGFPMIAKPAEGHSGIGICVIKNQKQFDDAPHDKLDVYSKFIDKKSEHRFFTFKGKPIFWQVREPVNDKAKNGEGDSDENMQFNYHKKRLGETPEKFKTLIAKFGKMFSDLPFICFDIMEDKKGKLYVIESNAMPGVPFDTTVDMYKTIFEDFYGRPVDESTEIKLQEYADFMLEKSKKMDGGKRFTYDK